MANIVDWGKLLNSLYADENMCCPECGGEVFGNIYSNDAKIGFVIFECSACKERVKLSRISIPKNVNIKNF